LVVATRPYSVKEYFKRAANNDLNDIDMSFLVRELEDYVLTNQIDEDDLVIVPAPHSWFDLEGYDVAFENHDMRWIMEVMTPYTVLSIWKQESGLSIEENFSVWWNSFQHLMLLQERDDFLVYYWDELTDKSKGLVGKMREFLPELSYDVDLSYCHFSRNQIEKRKQTLTKVELDYIAKRIQELGLDYFANCILSPSILSDTV